MTSDKEVSPNDIGSRALISTSSAVIGPFKRSALVPTFRGSTFRLIDEISYSGNCLSFRSVAGQACSFGLSDFLPVNAMKIDGFERNLISLADGHVVGKKYLVIVPISHPYRDCCLDYYLVASVYRCKSSSVFLKLQTS
jgi:hypothetical protein